MSAYTPDVHYFSNGSDHCAWEDAWCERCEHDRVFRTEGAGTGCSHALNLVSMVADPVFRRSEAGGLLCDAFKVLSSDRLARFSFAEWVDEGVE